MEKKEIDYRRYVQLKQLIGDIQHTENGELIPNDQRQFESVVDEIKSLENEYPDFNFFKNM